MTSKGEKPATALQVLSWSSWDWGSAAWNAVIVTFVFSVYLTDSVGAGIKGPMTPGAMLGWAIAAASVVIAVTAPVFGARSDGGRRKRSLAILTALIVAIAASLYVVKDNASYLGYGIAAIAIGTVVFELASVPYYAMLRQVSTPRNVGRISGLGWSFGYFGGIVLLLICYFGFVNGPSGAATAGLLHVPTADGLNIRYIALLCAAWLAVFALPLFLTVPEVPDINRGEKPTIRESYAKVVSDVTTLWREDRGTLKFLVASAVFRDGLAGVFTFGGILAVNAYGISKADVILFAVAANVISAIGAVSAGLLDDRLGPWWVIFGSLVAMIVAGIALIFVSGPTMFWIFGLALCIFVGPAQSASRSYLARSTDVGHEGRNFGLYAMTGRAASFLAPALFALSVYVFNILLDTDTDKWGIIGIVVVLAAGLALLIFAPRTIADRAELADSP